MARSFLILSLALFLSACSLVSTTTFKPWHGPEKVLIGQGGTMVEIDGKEFWEYGSPSIEY